MKNPNQAWKGWAATAGLAALLALAGLAAFAPARAGDSPAAGPPPTAKRIRFGRDIRPILSDRCFQCHGPDAGKRQAKLRLDIREEAIAPHDFGTAISPGNPNESEAWLRVSSTDELVRMPPAVSHKRVLSAEEQALFRRWIEEGAEYERHWSFVAPVRPETPAVKDAAWCRNPIDRFILARLEDEGLAPSKDAERATLLRRVFLDLTGLPPTPQELDDFLADNRPDAYERWVDKLLTTEPYQSRYAERMAGPWLDQARYADTCGIHMDAGRQMWLWRDWVLDAYRTNMPFDRFVTEQLAGDLIPDATIQQKIASGFNRNHVTSDEGGAIAEEYLVEYAVDRTATTGSVFLGLTVGCARCHDHKFDPVSQEEFYRLYSFFNSIEEPGLYSQSPDSNRAYEPFLLVPTKQQQARLDEMAHDTATLRQKLEERSPEEEQQRATFLADLAKRAGITWASSQITAAVSTAGATLQPQPDGSVLASGPNAKKDEYLITLRTDATGLRLLSLEALAEPTAPNGRVGRAFNGNAVITNVTVEVVSLTNPQEHQPVKFVWAWADHSQPNGNYDVTNLLDPLPQDPARGWALNGHERPGGRVALLLADKEFGFTGGTELRVKIEQNSVYDFHNVARPRLSLGTISDAGLALLPAAPSRWYLVGPFPGDEQNRVWEPEYGPGQGDTLDFTKNFGAGNRYWRFNADFADGRVAALADGRNVSYVGKYVYAPTARSVDLSLGSDDGFRLFVNGAEAAQRQIERGVAADQDKATIQLRPGRNAVVMKIVNTGGAAGFYYRPTETAELTGELPGLLLPEEHRTGELGERLAGAWRMGFLPSYRETAAKITALDKEKADIDMKVPRTMVMKELPMPRETFVLTRGQYNKPDKARPVHRAIPAALGKLPEGAPANRLGLSQWMVSPEDPLLARVTVNRLWELAFGTGLVRTSDDFGQQGAWPSHPELLDWLAVEFRESGWDVHHMLRLLVTSSTYRQGSTVRPEAREKDADNRLLAFFPRRRLTGEQIRDQALYVSGLLVEKLGGPSVKPYQPEGLWKEVAMPQSNTREFKRGEGEDLWRRSLYTYWKRAAPPPTMLTFDVPTRESCVTHRASTTTPLQALALWNDEQFREASRVLAERTLREKLTDRERLIRLFRRCTARAPDPKELAALEDALAAFKQRYMDAPEDAAGVVSAGAAPYAQELGPTTVAAWTMLASALLNLYETTTQE